LFAKNVEPDFVPKLKSGFLDFVYHPYLLINVTHLLKVAFFDFLEYDAPFEKEAEPLNNETIIIILSQS